MHIVVAIRPDLLDRFLAGSDRDRLAGLGAVSYLTAVDSLTASTARTHLSDAEVLLTGWTTGRVTREVLDAAPRLRAVIHTAGSVHDLVDPEVFDRGVLVSSQAAANAIPVAEYTVAMIVLSGKDAFGAEQRYRQRRQWVEPTSEFAHVGNFGRRVGLVGASRIGRRVCELLRAYQVQLMISDPYLSVGEARELGADLVELPELMAACSVVSLHAPLRPDTEHLIDASLLATLPDGATLINTARGGIVDQDALIDELSTGRIRAVLDVTDPEVSPPDSMLWTLPNVVLTPHLAGSQGNELFRLGARAVDEVVRVATGRPLHDEVSAADYARLA